LIYAPEQYNCSYGHREDTQFIASFTTIGDRGLPHFDSTCIAIVIGNFSNQYRPNFRLIHINYIKGDT
jgi:hypothetical protein